MATMRDVARHANVSVATVSFVVNDTKPVSPGTRRRVEDAMSELGFRRNALARALASRKSRIIALVFPMRDHSISQTAVGFFVAATEAANERGYSIVLWPLPTDSAKLADLASDGLIDGVILMEVRLDDERVDTLAAAGTPFALIGRTRDTSGLDFVDVDFEGMVADAIDRLVELGHRRIALLDSGSIARGLTGYGPVVRAEEAFHAVSRERGLEGIVVSCGETPAEGRALARRFGELAPGVTGLVVLNDNAVIGLVNELSKQGVRIPDDLSVILIGSTPEVAAMADPELAVIISPAGILGRMGAETLIDRLEGVATERRHELVPGDYIAGGSLGAAPAAPAAPATPAPSRT